MKRISLLLCALSLMLSSAHSVTTRSQEKIKQIWDYCINDDLEFFECWAEEVEEINTHELESLIRLCAQYGKDQCLEIFLKHPLIPLVLNRQDRSCYNITPLIEAICYGEKFTHEPEHCACAKLLLEAGACTKAFSSPHKRTALHVACEVGCPTCVEALIKYGANKTAQDRDGKTSADILKNQILHLKWFPTDQAKFLECEKYFSTPANISQENC